MADPSRDARKLSAPSSGEAQRTPSPGTVHRNQPAPGASAVEVLVSSPPTVSQTDPSSARAAEASSSSPFYSVRPVVASSTLGTSTHSASTTSSTIGVSSFDHRRTRSMPESGTPRIAVSKVCLTGRKFYKFLKIARTITVHIHLLIRTALISSLTVTSAAPTLQCCSMKSSRVPFRSPVFTSLQGRRGNARRVLE